jgi:hypothetical protein
MLYLKNTNQMQSLGGGVLRGPAGQPPSPPPNINFYSGLGRTTYSGSLFINPVVSPNSFATASVSQSAVLQDGILIPLFTPVQPDPVTFKFTQWLGYFKASTTETYTFYLRTDDDSVLWFGGAATASVLTTGSALIIDTSIPTTASSGSISLTSGSYYPMRIQYSSGLFDFFTSSFSTPTIVETKDYSGYIFANTASLGF